jgi:hypothetical protein
LGSRKIIQMTSRNQGRLLLTASPEPVRSSVIGKSFLHSGDVPFTVRLKKVYDFLIQAQLDSAFWFGFGHSFSKEYSPKSMVFMYVKKRHTSTKKRAPPNIFSERFYGLARPAEKVFEMDMR